LILWDSSFVAGSGLVAYLFRQAHPFVVQSMKPTATISNLTFSGGHSFSLKPDEKILLVGPNNSGKSESLREIMAITSKGANERTVVLKTMALRKTGTKDDLRTFFEEEGDYSKSYYIYKNWRVSERHLEFWSQPYLVHSLHSGFIKNIEARDRLGICDQQNSVSPAEQKSKPQHVLYDDDLLMAKVSRLFKRAFGFNLAFDFRGGKKLPIHVGDYAHLAGIIDRQSDAYKNAVRQLPLLDKQGDGMKSYAGILFETIVAELDITLIDEPEAFLHPPQMRRLGETLATEVAGQLIVATHSSDILRGFLEGTKGSVRILRIQRNGNINLVDEAAADVIRELWEKPELRYSNALEGIFHEQTILCEDDSDCRLFNSVADHVAADKGEQWKDTAYVPTGGKHGIPKIASVLRKIGVSVKAVFDIDFLSEQALVQSTVEAFGGSWTDIKEQWSRLDAAVRKGIKPKTAPEIKAEITKLLKEANEDDLPIGDVKEALKQTKPWHKVKRYGTIAIPAGDAQQSFNKLREQLEELGIYLVEVGEIENFCPEIGSHGPKFVTKLLSTIPLSDPRLANLRDFVEHVHV